MAQQPKSNPDVAILPYQSAWLAEFTTIATELRRVLGAEATRIDHIGSTSVPNLAAKNIIDMQITIRSLQSSRVTELLLAAGYTPIPHITRDSLVGLAPDSPELEKRYFNERVGERKSHLHIREQGRLNQRYSLLFRDYLRAQPKVRDAYATVKQELASHFAYNKPAYYRIKDPYMDTIYQAAELWAQLNDWQPDSDFS